MWGFLFYTGFVCLQEWFAVYVELNQQIAALLSAGEEEEVAELKALQQQLSDVCYRQAAQLENRQNVLQAAQTFHGTTQEVLLDGQQQQEASSHVSVEHSLCLRLQLSQQLDGLLSMLCADVAPADEASIQQNLKLLEEKLQAVGVCPRRTDVGFSFPADVSLSC